MSGGSSRCAVPFALEPPYCPTAPLPAADPASFSPWRSSPSLPPQDLYTCSSPVWSALPSLSQAQSRFPGGLPCLSVSLLLCRGPCPAHTLLSIAEEDGFQATSYPKEGQSRKEGKRGGGRPLLLVRRVLGPTWGHPGLLLPLPAHSPFHESRRAVGPRGTCRDASHEWTGSKNGKPHYCHTPQLPPQPGHQAWPRCYPRPQHRAPWAWCQGGGNQPSHCR